MLWNWMARVSLVTASSYKASAGDIIISMPENLAVAWGEI